jgi:hypothetical protein
MKEKFYLEANILLPAGIIVIVMELRTELLATGAVP